MHVVNDAGIDRKACKHKRLIELQYLMLYDKVCNAFSIPPKI